MDVETNNNTLVPASKLTQFTEKRITTIDNDDGEIKRLKLSVSKFNNAAAKSGDVHVPPDGNVKQIAQRLPTQSPKRRLQLDKK